MVHFRLMLHLIHAPLSEFDPGLPAVELRVERRVLAKRLWRGIAGDGAEFGFELQAPLRPGDTFHQTAAVRYVIGQEPEPVLEIALAGLPASAVAGIAWSVGNLHLDLSSDASHLRTPDEPAARRLLERIQIRFTPAFAVFRAGHFTRHAAPAHELGPGHKH